MIIGIGTDVCEIARFEASLDRSPHLRERLFTETERGLSGSSLAARFAAKEAVAKALGAPPGLSWLDVTVHRREHGRPELEVSGRVAEVAAGLGVRRWHVSLSHDGGLAVATVIAEG